MALILDSLYDALKAAGAPEEQARAAARDVANYDNRLNRIERDMTLLKWMVGVVIALLLGIFWMQWQMLDRLGTIDARIASVETRLAGVEEQSSRLEGTIQDGRTQP